MLGLTLREEFRDERLRSTAVELSNERNTGATQISAAEFLGITYPTRDVLKGIEAVGPNRGRPVVVIGERGKGKSHLLAALFHAAHDPTSTRAWLNSWGTTLNDPGVGTIPLRGMLVIGESLQRQRYKFLWDVLFAGHPHGAYVRGKWERMGHAKTDVPSDLSILELVRHTPTLLLLDEYQTWFDGLRNTKQYPWKTWALNFIQILTEIASEHPDLLTLVVCVRNGASDAYRQIHRVNPIRIDFKDGGSDERIHDHRQMLLHRLFENRLQISPDAIDALVSTHVAEYLRLGDVPASRHDRERRDFTAAWPFAPHLLRLLEAQVFVATDAQGTRDLICLLAHLFRNRGEWGPILTAADFRLGEDGTGIGAVLDSVANAEHRNLRQQALRTITSVKEALPDHGRRVPHLEEIMASLWLRSIAVGDLAGAEQVVLQIDSTRESRLDANAFHVELATIVENSFNIHQTNDRLVLREEENPQAKLMACARNDRLFRDEADLVELTKEIRYVVGGCREAARTSRVIALPKQWMTDPWSPLGERERPHRWDDRLPILVVPEAFDSVGERLGHWLKDHLPKRRNTVRFLLPPSGSSSIYCDRELLLLVRAAIKALEWSSESPDYRKLHRLYRGALRDNLKKRFDRFAVLRRWSFVDPRRCEVSVEALNAEGAQIPAAIEKAIVQDVFVPEDFEEVVLRAASENSSVGKLLKELQEPRPGGSDCIPWLGETAVKDRLLRLCAQGKIAINLRGEDRLGAAVREDEDVAFERLRTKLSSRGRRFDGLSLGLPSAVPATGRSHLQTLVRCPTPLHAPIGSGETTSSGATAVPCRGPLDMAKGSPDVAVASTDRVDPESVSKDSLDAALSSTGGVDPAFAPNVPVEGFGGIEPGSLTDFVSAATCQLNLIGKIESWGIGPATRVSEVTIKVLSTTGAQLRELLKKLPDGITYELSLRTCDSRFQKSARRSIPTIIAEEFNDDL